MAISAKDVMGLRKKTGLGMMECKQALAESDGDMEKAIDLLRQKGLAKMDSRADRAASEGRIAVTLSDDHTKAVIIEVNSETDFTSGNDVFKKMVDDLAAGALSQDPGDVTKTDAMQAAIDEVRLTTKENIQLAQGKVLGGRPGTKVGSYLHFTGRVGVLVEVETTDDGQADDALLTDLCMHIAAASPPPIAVNEEGVSPELVEKERQIAKAQAIEQGKPEQIAEKMVEGKIRKFYEEHVLVKQMFIKDDKKRIKDLLPSGVAITAFVRYQVGV
jgi:elongation factor Ts